MGNNILLIEDNPEMADNITGMLELAHYSVTHAPNGKIGVALAQKQLPDLILCDVMMPGLDGYGVLHILNSDPVTAFIPFIFLTAKADRSDVREGMNLGADDYITKPFDDVDLLKVIEIRLKKSEVIRAATNAPQQVSVFFNKAREVKELKTLSENRPVKTLHKNSIIFMEGHVPNDVYFIERGKIKTYKLNADGKELITGIHKEGSFFGYLPLLEDEPYQENAAAMEETKIAMIPKEDFLRLLYTSKDVARNFIKLLSNNLSELEARLIDLAYQSLRQRVARVLLHLNDTLQQGETHITTTRRDIANIVGTATESLNRTLGDLRDEGLIDITGDGLTLRCREKLQRMMYG